MINPNDKKRRILFVGVGLHSLISLANLYIDFPILSGKLGLIPDEVRNQQILNEFRISTLLAFFPSLQYFFDPELLILVGICASLLLIVAGTRYFTGSRILCGCIYLILLSFSNSMGVLLWFPWDCLLFEMLFLSAVCPHSDWVFEWLFFRVMFGFGKHKFIGASEWSDLTYTASMACWQPLGTSVGWLLSFAPDFVHIFSILATFLVEMICPFCIFFGKFKKISAMATIVLMAGIQLSGHFGWFNTLTSLLAWLVSMDDEAMGGKIVEKKREQLAPRKWLNGHISSCL